MQIDGADESVGECSLTKQGESAEIGFMFLPKYWHQGYGTEVVNSLIDKAQTMKIKELTATTDERNRAAIHLLEKCGFQKQRSGWMVMLPEDEDDKMGEGQNIILFRKEI
ncbi:MAG: GNAT family N-acetyltransferase [Clostridia bacterium]|nr:GNAT family N-acetyltransferase [Clostridia bacterium]